MLQVRRCERPQGIRREGRRTKFHSQFQEPSFRTVCVVLGADIVQGIILDAVADFLRHPGLARERLPCATEVAIGDDGDHTARWRHMQEYSVPWLTYFDGSI